MQTRLALAILLLTAACGGGVTVGDGAGAGGDGAAGSATGAGGQSEPACALCGAQDCGLCAQTTGSATIFSCRGSSPPATSLACYQTGSVFHDETGTYVCWSCD